MAKKKAAKANGLVITKAEIAEYMRINAERLALQRKAAALEKQEKSLVSRMVAYVNQTGGKHRSCTLHGYVLALIKKAGQIAWKQEFIAKNGQEAADAIVAPERDALTVTPIGG